MRAWGCAEVDPVPRAKSGGHPMLLPAEPERRRVLLHLQPELTTEQTQPYGDVQEKPGTGFQTGAGPPGATGHPHRRRSGQPQLLQLRACILGQRRRGLPSEPELLRAARPEDNGQLRPLRKIRPPWVNRLLHLILAEFRKHHAPACETQASMQSINRSRIRMARMRRVLTLT